MQVMYFLPDSFGVIEFKIYNRSGYIVFLNCLTAYILKWFE